MRKYLIVVLTSFIVALSLSGAHAELNAVPNCRENFLSVDALAIQAAPLLFAQATTEHQDRYGRGESYWRGRADDLREKLKTQEANYEVVLQQERECEERKGSSRNCISLYNNQKIQTQQKIEKLKKSLEIDLPEEARKADAYPGWVR